MTATLTILALLCLAALAGAQQRTTTPLIQQLNSQAVKIRQARANRCLTPPVFRWHPGHEVPPHMRGYVVNQRRERLLANRARAIQCGVGNIIRLIFGPYASQALVVAECESTVGEAGRWAVNGQYVGIFQMGEWERENYGWYTVGAPALVQVRSAYRYFVASGSDWSPWACKP